jgi:uncharacterized protein (TIGR03437 family)
MGPEWKRRDKRWLFNYIATGTYHTYLYIKEIVKEPKDVETDKQKRTQMPRIPFRYLNLTPNGDSLRSGAAVYWQGLARILVIVVATADGLAWANMAFNATQGGMRWAVAGTSLDGTSVTIGGQAAFIDFISLGQVNALVPSNVATGTQPLTLMVENVASATYSITVNPVQPGLDAPPSFKIGGTQYAAALFADGTYVLPEGAIACLTSRPAQPGDEIVLYGVGFGPVTPNIPAGQLVQQANTLTSSFEMSIGGVPVTNVPYSGLAPSYTGLYQFNIVVPANTGSGAVPLTFTVDGVAGTQTLYLAVGN